MKKTTCCILIILGLTQAYGQDKKIYVTKTSKYKAAHIYASGDAQGYQQQIIQGVGLDTLDFFKGAYGQIVPVNVQELRKPSTIKTTPQEVTTQTVVAEIPPSRALEVQQPMDTAMARTLEVVPIDSVASDSLMQLEIRQTADIMDQGNDSNDSLRVAAVLAGEGKNEKYAEDPGIGNMATGDSLQIQGVKVDSAGAAPIVYAIDPLLEDSALVQVDSVVVKEMEDSLNVDSTEVAGDSVIIDMTAPTDTTAMVPSQDVTAPLVPVDSLVEVEYFNPVEGVSSNTVPVENTTPLSVESTATPTVTPTTNLGSSTEDQRMLQEEIRKQKLRNELIALQREAQDPALSRLNDENQYLKERLAFERERQQFYRQLAESRGISESRNSRTMDNNDRSKEVEDLRKQILAIEAATATTEIAANVGSDNQISQLSSRIEALNQRVITMQQTQSDKATPEIENLKAQISQLQKQLEVLKSTPSVSIPASPVEMEQTNIYFRIGSKTLGAAGLAQLDDVTAILTRQPTSKVRLKGYTDSSGDPDRNILLSRQRAAAVQEYLMKQGIAPDRVVLEYFGADLGYQGLNPAYARRVQIELVH